MNLAKSNVVLLVAAVVLAVPTWLQLRSEAEVFTDISRIPLLFDGFTPDNVGQVLLGKPKAEQPPPDPQNPDQKRPVAYDQLLLVKSDKGFQLGATAGDRAGAPVLKDRVERDVFAHLQAIRADRETLVQPNAAPDQLANYGLDEEHAFLIKVVDTTGKHVTAELLVGRDAGAGQTGTEAVRGVFVRKSDSTDVILYEPQPAGWRRDVDETLWLDKVLAKLEPDKVRRLSIRNTASGEVPLVFAREEGKSAWQAVDAPQGVGAVRQTEVETLLQRLRYLAVQDFRLPLARAGNLQQLGLLPPAIELELTLHEEAGDRVLRLAVGNKVDGKNEYYLTSSEVPFLMTWPAGTVTPFELDARAQLFDPPAPPADDGSPPADGNK
ncbi:MAG: DUF4340 domain-containing protein [Planctomycetes bacterium]|nr:DUF4340 domain-containing protein [Planctomycetota bacterium]